MDKRRTRDCRHLDFLFLLSKQHSCDMTHRKLMLCLLDSSASWAGPVTLCKAQEVQPLTPKLVLHTEVLRRLATDE